MKRGKKIVQILVRSILALVLIANLTVICLEKIKGADSLENLPYALLTLEGSSMEPEYHHGDGVFVWQTPYEKLKVGDIIVFMQAGELITHEIMEIKNGVITAKGTANDIADEPVYQENYRAKVLFRIPDMANVQAVYENPAAFIIFALLLGLLIFGKDIFSKIYDRFGKE